MKKKVLFFAVSQKSFSGSQKMTYNILANLDRNEFIPELLVQSESPLKEKAEALGVKVHSIPFPKMLNLIEKIKFKILKYILALIPWLFYSIKVYYLTKSSRINILWCGNRWATLLSWLVVFNRKVKLVSNIWSPIYSRFYLSIISLLSNSIIVETFAQKKIFANINFKPEIIVIYTGIGEELFKKSTDIINTKLQKRDVKKVNSKIKIGALSGCRYGKGYDVLVKVAHALILQQRRNDVSFLIGGKSQADDLIDDPRLIKKVDEIRNNFKLLEWIEKPHHFYEEIDVFISVSRREGLPGAVREAMGFGVPVIATDVGGSVEAIGDTGLIISGNISSNNDNLINEISNKLTKLIDNNEYRIKLGNKAKKRFKNLFFGNGWVKEVERVFHNL